MLIQGEPTPPAPPARPAVCVLRVSPSAPIDGSAVRIEATFTVDGQPHDPAEVTYQLRAPGEPVLTATGGQLASGVYELVALLNRPGLWAIRVEGFAGEGVAERELYVRPSAL